MMSLEQSQDWSKQKRGCIKPVEFVSQPSIPKMMGMFEQYNEQKTQD